MKLKKDKNYNLEPVCKHFGVCGGCKLQHIPYMQQLLEKEMYVSNCFSTPSHSILACHPPWHYRNKMEFTFSQDKKGEKYLGLYKRKGRVENLQECGLTPPWFIEALHSVRHWWQSCSLAAYHPPSNTGLLRTLTLREGVRTKEKMVILTVSEECFEEAQISFFVANFPHADSVILRRQIIQKKVPTRFEEKILKGKDYIHEIIYDQNKEPFHFRIRAASFFQPNTLQAEILYQKALKLADLQSNDRLLDLYCGTGSFGILAARSIQEVVGVETVPEAIEDGRFNLKLNQITNIEFFQGDVAEILSKISFSPTLVIADPPRAGLGNKTLSVLLKLEAEKIVYVSCNPLSQASDIEVLKNDYELKALQPVDQFPHTPHIENIALLHRR